LRCIRRNVTKAQIDDPTGVSLSLPDLITEGLAANDRIKYYLTLLQTADAHARQPLLAAPDLRDTRESNGIVDATLDGVVAAARAQTGGSVLIPGAERIRASLVDDIHLMMEPLRAAAALDDDARRRFDAYCARIDRHTASTPLWTHDQLDAGAVDALTSAGDDAHDSMHRLVMDLHRELNRLLATVAIESIDGARAWGTTAADRVMISAFMRGVNRTAMLKFDHPGLGTTATRTGDRLSIQNDLGTTDGHIVVIHVDGLTATLVYSDVHHKRVTFLRKMLEPLAIAWQPGVAAAGGSLETIVGRFTAADTEDLARFLPAVGSRLVFLIDWNRARKQLVRFVKKNEAIAVLDWAAANDVGHRGFLQAGGVQLIATAFERIAPARIRYGVRLDEMIGDDAARSLLEAVLRIASTGLQAGQSVRLLQDQVEAELLSHLETSERHILDAAAQHAMLMSALAERVRATLARIDGSASAPVIARTAALAKAWEIHADEIVRSSNHTIERRNEDRHLEHLLEQADDVADALEETAFLLTLIPPQAGVQGLDALRRLADLVSAGTKAYVRALESARDFAHSHTRSDMDDVLVCIDRIAETEHASHVAERAAKATLVTVCADFRELQVLSEVAHGFEQAADALARCALTIRDYALSPEWGHQ
jgi:uncharacterized protein Yka (UPF0111/DUF47 family)